MEYTEEQKQEFKAQYALRKRRQLMVTLPLIVVVIAVAVADTSGGSLFGAFPAAAFLPVFLIIVFAVLIFSFRNWRCPACNKYLGKSLSLRFCPKCGIALRD